MNKYKLRSKKRTLAKYLSIQAGQPELFYFGSVDGGVWRTNDAGRTWNPIFDSRPVGSIGAIAVAPSNPAVIYVGSGEADMRSDIAYGNGMYKSSDTGKSWQHIGLSRFAPDCAYPRRPCGPRECFCSRTRPCLRPQRRTWCFSFEEWGKHLATHSFSR